MLSRCLATSRVILLRQSAITLRPAATSSITAKFGNQKNDSCWRGTPFRAFSATAVASSSTIVKDLPPIPEIPAASLADPAAQALEPTFASLGLGGWSPVGVLQNALEFLHIDCGLPWWGTIIASTIAMRLLLTPVVIISQRNAANMNNAMPDIQKIQLKMTEARQRGNASETAMFSQELMQTMTKNKISPLKNMIVPLCQAPIFMSFFFGIRRMVNAPVESLQTGGLSWFTDLTATDPYFILPLATCVTLLVTIEVGADFTRVNSPNAYLMKYVMRAIPVITLPFIINFPCATVLYWTTSNAVSLVQATLFKIPAIRKACKIPMIVKHKPADLPAKPKKFVEGVRDSWKNMKLSRELEGRKNLDEINFQRAGSGTVVRTYKYDPTKQQKAAVAQK